MSDIDNAAEIIEIPPENIIEGKVEDKIEPKPPQAWGRIIAIALGVSVVSAIGGGWAYRDLLSSYLPSDQVRAMATRMDGLESTGKTLNKKVEAVVGFTDEIKSQLAAAQTAAAEVAKLQESSSSVKASVANLEKTLAAANSSLEEFKAQVAASASASVAAMPYSNGGTAGPIPNPVPYENPAFAARISALEKDVESMKQVSQTAVDTTVLSQSLADLKAKIAAGTSYQSEIDRIAVMVPAADGLDFLQSHAAQGLPNALALGVELRSAAASLPKPAPTPAPDGSWWGYANSMLGNLVTIKIAGTEDWDQVASQVAALAEQGDLGAAVTNLTSHEGALPVELQRWHDRAAARLGIEHALEMTSAAVLRQIAAKG